MDKFLKGAVALLFLSFLFIHAGGEHLDGPFILFVFYFCFTGYFLMGIIPIAGLILLIVAFFGNKSRLKTLSFLGMVLLYIAIGGILASSNTQERDKMAWSLLPFVLMSCVMMIVFIMDNREAGKKNTS